MTALINKSPTPSYFLIQENALFAKWEWEAWTVLKITPTAWSLSLLQEGYLQVIQMFYKEAE